MPIDTFRYDEKYVEMVLSSGVFCFGKIRSIVASMKGKVETVLLEKAIRGKNLSIDDYFSALREARKLRDYEVVIEHISAITDISGEVEEVVKTQPT